MTIDNYEKGTIMAPLFYFWVYKVNVKIADVKFVIHPKSAYLYDKLKPFSVEGLKPLNAIEIFISEQDVNHFHQENNTLTFGQCESFACLQAVNREMLNYGGIFIHSATFEYKKCAYMFVAEAGGGKTTQLLLWKRYAQEEISIINGDKPFYRNINGEIYAYGSPWAGKEDLKENISAPLKGIFFLKKSRKNYISDLDKRKIPSLLLRQTIIPSSKREASHYFSIINMIIENIPCFLFKCTKNKVAYEVCRNHIDRL